MMSENGKFGKFLVGFLQVLIVLGMLWGEFGGIYHAFKHYGVGDGFIAIFVPPYSWYRSIEFFFWMKRGGLTRAERNEISHFGKSIQLRNEAMSVLQEGMSGEIVGTIEQEKLNESLNLKPKINTFRETPQKWPELTAEELSKISQIIGKALQQPLKDEDLERIKRVNKSYIKRVGRSWTGQEAELFTQLNEITYKYNYELGSCLLYSIDSKQPFISNDLERLRAVMEALGFARKSKLDADFRKIIAAANGEVWIDGFGQKHHPLTRKDVLDGLKEIKVMKANFEKLSKIFKELAEEQDK